MKKQAPIWEKIFAEHVSDKGLISKMHKEVLKLNSKKTIHFLKWAKHMDTSKRRYEDGK